MPFRTKELLEEWLAEFTAQGHHMPGELEVLRHDESESGDTGLVVVRLANAAPYAYAQPVGPGDPHWSVTFAPREHELTLPQPALRDLAQDITVAADLCSFLEEKSAAYLASLEPGSRRV